jgi:hypothetical protein
MELTPVSFGSFFTFENLSLNNKSIRINHCAQVHGAFSSVVKSVNDKSIHAFFVNYSYSCLLILTPALRGFPYIFHVYLEEWHSDVSRHWPLNQAVASTACEMQKKI